MNTGATPGLRGVLLGLAGVLLGGVMGGPPTGAAAAGLDSPFPQDRPTPLAIQQATEKLESSDWILQAEGMNLLARWGVRDAVPAIRKILEANAHPWLRGRALVALARLLGAEALDEALDLADDPSPLLRAAAVEALGLVGSPHGVEPVKARLQDADPAVRRPALVALARLQGEKAWPTVEPKLESADPQTVRYAARALVHVATPEARRRLLALLDHDSPAVRAEAARGAGAVGDPSAIPRLVRAISVDDERSVQTAAMRALTAFDQDVLAGPLMEILRGDDPRLYGLALRLLARDPAPAICRHVAGLIREPSERYRGIVRPAMRLLAETHPDQYADVFARYLDHPADDVRREAVRSVAQAKEADHFALLRDLLTDRDEDVREAAFETLHEAAAGATPPGGIVAYLEPALRSTDIGVYQRALRLLSDRMTPADFDRALEVLRPELAGGEPRRRNLAAMALDAVADDSMRVQVAAAQGYLTEWKVVGPFPNDRTNRGLAVPYPPEREVDFDATYERWQFGHHARFETGRGSSGGPSRRTLLMAPPQFDDDDFVGGIIARYELDLPPAPALGLVLFYGLRDGTEVEQGGRFAVTVAGRARLERDVAADRGWQGAEVDLSDHTGRRVVLELAFTGRIRSARDEQEDEDDRQPGFFLVGEARIVAGNTVVADLVTLASSAVARISDPRAEDGRIAWTDADAVRVDGGVSLYQVLRVTGLGGNYVAYGVADVQRDEAGKAVVEVEADDAFRLWLNGKPAAESRSPRTRSFEADLRAGVNRFVIKAATTEGDWSFKVRLTPSGGPGD